MKLLDLATSLPEIQRMEENIQNTICKVRLAKSRVWETQGEMAQQIKCKGEKWDAVTKRVLRDIINLLDPGLNQ